MPASQPLDDLKQLAAQLPGIDVDCYRRHGCDPAEPLVGLGAADARWCFFGRDPGEHELRLHKPFVGAAGQKIRAVMAATGVAEGDVFWINTVPFKPVGNKAWSLAVRRACQPSMLQLLAGWQGSCVIAFGEAAFKWFGLGDAAVRREVDRFWQRPDRYEAQLVVALQLAGEERRFTLCPVPHPSGANAAWAKQFPHLLGQRLRGGCGA